MNGERDHHIVAKELREIDADVVASLGRWCEGSLECAEFLERVGMPQDAEAAKMLRGRAASLSDIAFRTAAPRVQP